MPNHVLNRVTITGESARVKTVLESIQNDKYGIGSIDFQKIVLMPPELDVEIVSDSIGKARKLYRTYGEKCTELSDFPPLIRRYLFNLVAYGSATWYDWCIRHWGTKWNAYGYPACLDGFNPDNPVLTFDTAWACPEPVIDALAEQYPDIDITHQWADEDIAGENCGERQYEEGEMTYEDRPKGEDAIQFACTLRDIDPEEYLTSDE